MGKVQQQSPNSFSFVRKQRCQRVCHLCTNVFRQRNESQCHFRTFQRKSFKLQYLFVPPPPEHRSKERQGRSPNFLDLSYPIGWSINDYVSKDFYLGQKMTLSYPVVDQFMFIVKLKGRSCLLFKRDLSRAYRQIVLDPGKVSLLGYSFNGNVYLHLVTHSGSSRDTIFEKFAFSEQYTNFRLRGLSFLASRIEYRII